MYVSITSNIVEID